MAETTRIKTYPEYTSFSTSTVVACAKCHHEVVSFASGVTDGKSYWHKACAPMSSEPSEVHTVDFPKVKEGE